MARLLRHPARLRLRATVRQMEQTGLDATPIVGLLSFLIGVVMAFQGADQLRRFGGEIYTVNLLGITILRELGVLLAAIIIAGRSGSAFTAQIGTMQVNQEIDALRTLGLDPIEVLVLPRVFGLMLTLPLLVFYADALGLIGGCLMTWATLGITRAGLSRAAARRDHQAGPCGSASSRRRFSPRSSRWSGATRGSTCRAAPRASGASRHSRSSS